MGGIERRHAESVTGTAGEGWGPCQLIEEGRNCCGPPRPVDELVARESAIAHAVSHPVYDDCYLVQAERERPIVVTTDSRLDARMRRESDR